MPSVPARASRSPVAAALVALAFVLALLQRPGVVVADTKVHLYVDPGSFLGQVLSAWTPTADLGHVWAGQYAGYAWPMAPWFAAGDALGLPVWLVHRLWLGTLLALAAVGVVRLLQALVRSRPGALHLVAGLLYVVNPYVAVYANRTSVSLLAYAALPWLLLATHRALRDPRGWRWPAAFALILTSTAGGINATVTFFVLLAPVALVAYEALLGQTTRRAVVAVVWRMVLVNAVVSAWWLVPTVVHAGYGLNFLPFTEQPGTIWGTTSLTESLRLMGFWTSYIGVGYGGQLRPFAGHGPVLLFNTGVVVAGLLVPAAALTAYAAVRRERYAPLLLAFALGGLVLMAAGFPEGTPLRSALTFVYNRVEPAQVLRTTYKAGPLLALGLAGLGGLGAAAAWGWLGGAAERGRPEGAAWRRGVAARPRLARGVAAGVGLVVVVVAAWPLTTGRAPERQLAFTVPEYWRDAASALDRRPPNTRALVVPGQLFASYRWGQTIDPILPALTDHPVATRSIVPYADLRSVELQWAVDDLVSQQRTVPGQLPSLLDLLGVGEVLLAADGDRTRSGELGPLEAARALRDQSLAFAPAGPPLRVRPSAGRIAVPRTLPALQRAPSQTGGIVRAVPRRGTSVLDGGAAAITGLAAFGALDPAAGLAYAPDLEAKALRRVAGEGGRVVVADGNRRQAFVSSRLRNNRGPVLRADQDVSQDGTMLDPFSLPTGPRDPDQQTVAVLLSDQVSAIDAPASPQVTQFPEHRPAAALDGDPATFWLADRALAPDRWTLTVRFKAPRDVEAIDVTPYSDSRARTRAITVNGQRFDLRGGPIPQRLPLGLRGVRALEIKIVDVGRPRRQSAGAGGLREVAIPGVRVEEALRPPVVAERALRGAAAAPLSYLFERTTAADPLARPRQRGEAAAGLVRDSEDPERQLLRLVEPPAMAAWRASAWVHADPRGSDAILDRLAGVRGALTATSSARFANRPGYRASGAFDGTTDRAWIGQFVPGRPAWLAWRVPASTRLQRLRLVPARVRVRRPTRVRLTVDGRVGAAVAVAPDGAVALPRAVTGRRFRLDVLAARFPPGTPGAVAQRRAVGVAELEAPGLPRLSVPRFGPVVLPCGSARVGLSGPAAGSAQVAPAGGAEQPVALRVTTTVEALDAGAALRAVACGPPTLRAAGPMTVRGLPAPLVVDRLRLQAAGTRAAPGPGAPRPGVALPGGAAGRTVARVVDPGRSSPGAHRGVAVRATGPAYLVLGESYSPGWRATCDGRDLGPALPRQGYANAWPIEAPGCRSADLTFAPNRLLGPARALSVGGAIVLGLLLLVSTRRRRSSVTVDAAAGDPEPLAEAGAARIVLADPEPLAEAGPPVRLPLPRALAIGAACALVLGFVFALRAGVVLGPVVALILWRGVATRTLVLTAGGLLGLVVPLLYVLFPAKDRGGFSTTYATDHLAAHWVAVGAVGLLLAALARGLRAASRSRPEQDIA